jgi:hypothetical protein
MAVGDAVNAFTSTANNANLDVQPGSGVEWFIHTVYGEEALGAYEIWRGDDASFTNSKKVRTVAAGDVHGLTYRVTNAKPMRIKNVSGATQFLGYDGVITK